MYTKWLFTGNLTAPALPYLMAIECIPNVPSNVASPPAEVTRIHIMAGPFCSCNPITAVILRMPSLSPPPGQPALFAIPGN